MERVQTESGGMPPGRAWLLIDCSRQGQVRLAVAAPGAAPVPGSVHRYESTIPTFTDVLLRFEQDSGHRLLGLDPVVAIAGVPSAQSTIVERSRWVISRAGLASLFGKPATILNEVAAQAWALRGSLQGVTCVHGRGPPDLLRRGRYVFLTYEEGVGTAIVDIDEAGRCTVLDAEGGQLDFTPINDAERALAQSIAGTRTPVASWEQVLMIRRRTSDRDHAREPPERNRLFAQLLGRFVSNLIYTAGAWNGAFMTGRLIPRFEETGAEFARGLEHQRPYHRLLAGAACWRVAQPEAVLRGCAAMLADRHFPARPPPGLHV